MFAESRRLVPNWHPIYRESYTVESLRERAERPGKVPGLWEALQAIARLAHKGCRAGSLIVPAFNGRLFSPARSPIAESCAIDDEVARKALLALSTTTGRPGRPEGRHHVRGHHAKRTRIDYRDLGVEQLGAVYESVLDYEPAYADSKRDQVLLRRGGDARKSTGSFYTPQTLTDYVVRRTLHPLVDGAPADRILQLRVVDPAMGSAAFLVSACRYLARAYERALVRDGSAGEPDIDEADRAMFRRLVAQRCLFGVDLNPTAVQLARLSLWLATLSASKPLTFLDHHLVCGNSLIGASPVDIARQPPGARSPRLRNHTSMPLFSDADLEPSLARAVVERRWLADTRDDTADVVREKERRLERTAHRRAMEVGCRSLVRVLDVAGREQSAGCGGVRIADGQIDHGTLRPSGKNVGSPSCTTPTASPPRIASFTGCSNFQRRTSTRRDSLSRTAASTRCWEIRRGTCCARAAPRKRSSGARASTAIKAPDTSTAIRCSWSARWP